MQLGRRPRLSVVVVVHRMRRQAMNTLRTLTPDYQRDVAPRDYEVVVVENASDEMLDSAEVAALDAPIRYLARTEAGVSPAAAVNAGIRAARGRATAVMVDGARMLTPGVLGTTLTALRMWSAAVVAVPGYHVGSRLHQEAAGAGYTADEEQAWLLETGWQADGYRLFGRAVLSGSCSAGYLLPLSESNFLALPTKLLRGMGGVDERFRTPGGGYVNLDLYARACRLPGVHVVVLPGEGTFHQFHGGATTGDPSRDRGRLVAEIAREYESIRGATFAPPVTVCVLLGAVHPEALPFLAHSAQRAIGVPAG